MKIFAGKVVSAKNQKTVIVEVERFFAHPLYEKRVRRTKRYPVHDEVGTKEGDIVRFGETAPISKTKRWKVVGVVVTNNKKEQIVAKKEKEVKPKRARRTK